MTGERVFESIGCARCHVPELPLTKRGWIYTEPNPFNPPTNLRPGDAATLRVDLNDPRLPQPRLTPAAADADVVMVAAYTDFKLHDITDPADPEAAEPIDMNQSLVSPRLRGGQSQVPDQAAVGRRERAAVLPSRAVHHPPPGRPRARRRGARRTPPLRADAGQRTGWSHRVPQDAAGPAAGHAAA